MIIGLIGLNLGMDFIAFYTSFKIAIDSAINLALIGVNPEKIQKINDHQAFPLITTSNINSLSSFEKIQNEDLSINNSKKKVREYEDILNTLFSTDAGISVTDQLKYKELFGSEPLSFLTTVGSLLSSRQYLKQLASQLQISVDAIGVDILTNAYKMSIRNVIEFMSNLKGSASFTKSHFAATVSSLSMKPDMSSKPILSQSIKNALNQRSREELRALIGQAGSQAAAASNSKAANYITKISANILQGSNSNQNSGLQVNRTNTSTAGNKARSFNNTNQELMNSLGINQSTNSKKPESKTSSNQGSGLSPQAVKNRAQKVKNNISVTNNAFPDDIDQ
jgi:hypothetical protein